jgi:hypothetical protein
MLAIERLLLLPPFHPPPIVLQAVFFSYFDFSAYEGFYWMGTGVVCLSAFTSLLFWPM